MKLTEVIKGVAPSVVAFGTRLSGSETGAPPGFPRLIGTGFIVDERGLIVTNQHVIDALPRHQDFPPFVMIFPEPKAVAGGISASLVVRNIVGVNSISAFTSQGPYFGEKKPDLAFVHIDVRGLPPLGVSAEPNEIEVGLEVVTLGFPLGAAPMTPYDPAKASQFCALARHGIVSSVIPCPCPEPHGFSIDVLSEGGASGSPIFRADDARVIGVLHQSFEHAPITYGVPGHFVEKALSLILRNWKPDLSRTPTLEEITSQMPNPGPAEFSWKVVKTPDTSQV